METQELFKSLFLLIIGGIVTYIVTLLSFKFTNKKAKITYQVIPSISLPEQNIIAYNWIVENKGTKAGLNICMKIALPTPTNIITYECVASERAIEYSHALSQNSNELNIKIPNLPCGTSLNISSLISEPPKSDIDISIIGDDLIGTKHQVSEKLKSLRKFDKYLLLSPPLFIFIFFSYGFYKFALMKFYAEDALGFMQTRAIADAYVEKGKYKEAIDIYNALKISAATSDNFQSTIRCEKWIIYALGNQREKLISSIDYLIKTADEEEIKHFKYYAHVLETDFAFDKYRKDEVFLTLLERLKKDN